MPHMAPLSEAVEKVYRKAIVRYAMRDGLIEAKQHERVPRSNWPAAQPYERRGRGFLSEMGKLTAANVWVAPQTSIWLAACKPTP